VGDSAIVVGARTQALAVLGQRLSDVPTLVRDGLERGDATACERLQALLVEVRDTLILLGRPAIALVAGDAARVVDAVATGTLVERPANGPEDLLRAVLGAHEVLSDVVAEAVEARRSDDVPDTALPALDVLNALRALLGDAFLSSALLLALDIRIDENDPLPDPEAFAPAVRALRPRLMRQLVDWFKAVNEENADKASAATASLALLIGSLADDARAAGLGVEEQDVLGAAAGIAEAVSTRRLSDDGALRRLFGQFERWLVERWIAPSRARPGVGPAPRFTLLRNLLYYVATATPPSDDRVWADLVERYSLDRVARLARAGIDADAPGFAAQRSPGRRLRRDVVARVRDDLQPLVDWLAQGGRTSSDRAAVQRGDRLRELLPVFELLGAQRCRQRLSDALASLDAGSEEGLDEPARLSLARQFVLFDEALTDLERGWPQPPRPVPAMSEQGGVLSQRMALVGRRADDADQQVSSRHDAVGALVGEARRRLADSETALERAVGGQDDGMPTEPLATRLRRIARALDIVPRPEASALIDRLADIVGWLPDEPSAQAREALAEYVVSIDACLANDGRQATNAAADPLDAAEHALAALERHLPAARALDGVVPARPPSIEVPEPIDRTHEPQRSSADGSRPTDRALDAFAAIGAALADDVPDVDTLAGAFGTLRLAARETGHEQLERLATAAGRRLSLCSLPLSASTASAILDAHLALPQLIEGLDDPAGAVVLDDLDDTLRALDVDATEPMDADDAIDGTLREVFVAECAQHLVVLEDELAAMRRAPVALPPSDRLLRALHTLSGSARTAAATRVDEIARPMHHGAMALQARAEPLDSASVALFEEAVTALERARLGYERDDEAPAPRDGLTGELGAIGQAPVSLPATRIPPVPERVGAPAVRPAKRHSLDEIFAEEARELLDKLAAIADGPGPQGPRADRALMALHTLKGSARVAGQPQLADRAHEAESEVAAAASDADCIARLRTVRRELDALLVSPMASVRPVPATVADRHAPGSPFPADEPADLIDDSPFDEAESPPAEADLPDDGSIDVVTGPEADLARVYDDPTLPEPSGTAWLAEAADPVPGADGPIADTPELTRVRERDWERLMTLAQDIAGSQARLSAELVRVQEASRELELAAQRWRRLPAAATVLETEAARELLSDLSSVRVTLRDALRAVDTEQRRGARAGIALQQDLVRARLVRFDACRERLARTLEDAASAVSREAELIIDGGATTLDATLHGRLLPALEHLVRNAVVHGIEDADERERSGKPRCGRVRLSASIEGVDILIRLHDDGRGIDVGRVAERLGVDPSSLDSSAALLEALANSGLSTVDDATEISGHGIGVGAVRERLSELGGRLRLVEAADGLTGARFELRLPQRIPVQQVVLVQAGELVAVPVNTITGIEPIAADTDEDTRLASLLGHEAVPERSGDRSAWRRLRVSTGGDVESVRVESVIGYREIVVQPLDVQLASLGRYTGIAALPDGRRVFVIDPAALGEARPHLASPIAENAPGDRPLALIADDSPTQRAWSSDTFESLGYRVLVTRDGREALDALERCRPDVMLLDVDMPRVDGFGVLEALQQEGGAVFPILVLTSRHSARDRSAALAFGAADFLAKPGSQEMLHDALVRAGAPVPDGA